MAQAQSGAIICFSTPTDSITIVGSECPQHLCMSPLLKVPFIASHHLAKKPKITTKMTLRATNKLQDTRSHKRHINVSFKAKKSISAAQKKDFAEKTPLLGGKTHFSLAPSSLTLSKQRCTFDRYAFLSIIFSKLNIVPIGHIPVRNSDAVFAGHEHFRQAIW